MKTVYLAGPIANTSVSEALGWRAEAGEMLAQLGLRGVSPLRGKETWIRKYDMIPSGGYEGMHEADRLLTATPQAIFTRDMADVHHCDGVLAFMPKISFGTSYELGVAHELNKPIVAFGLDPDLAQHPFIAGSRMIVVPDMGTAIAAIHGLLHGKA